MGKLGFFLSVIMISIAVISLIVNAQLFRVINQLTTVNNQLNHELQKQNLERFSAWVNKIVGFGGRLLGPLNYSGFPYNYLLLEPINVTLVSSFDPYESTTTMVRPETDIIGVLWNGGDHYEFDYVVVIGIVKERNIIISPHTRDIVFYYIEAHQIERIMPRDY